MAKLAGKRVALFSRGFSLFFLLLFLKSIHLDARCWGVCSENQGGKPLISHVGVLVIEISWLQPRFHELGH
ncbi:hypothetical protein SDJN02_05316, partial [Cucurbita argyrosperma subsp. argyrosperma]